MSSTSTPTEAPASSTDCVHQKMHTVTPHLICAGAADAIEFYKKAFAATEIIRIPGENGKLMHGAISIGDSMVMLMDEAPEWNSLGPNALKGSSVTIHLHVDDSDAWFDRAVKAGATSIMPVQEMFWGDRYGVVQDPFGHMWSIATPVKTLTEEELMKAAAGATCGQP